MRSLHVYLFAAMALALVACGTRASSSVTPTTGADPAPAAGVPAKVPQSVIVTQNDITDRPYRALGDIDVTVSKWTIFDADPTPAKVDDELREKAASMGADAVVLVRYGTVGIGAFTWGKLEGKGRAVAFTK